MNSKLSFNAIAATLATLGATGLVACGGSAQPPAKSPVQAHEVPAAAPAAHAEASCGAANTQTTKSAAKTDDDSAAAGSTADAKGDSTQTNDPKASDPKTNDPKSDAKDEKTAMKKKGAGAMASCSAARRAAHRADRAYHPKKKRAAGAKSSCGAGTCS